MSWRLRLLGDELIVTDPDGRRHNAGSVPKAQDGTDGKPGKDGRSGVDGKPGADGEPGPAGKDGTDGRNGKDGRAGKDGDRGPAGPKGDQGLPGVAGTPGRDGVDGAPGATGPMPRHEWRGTHLRFQAPDGWGEWIDLRGKDGKDGKDGKAQVKGSPGLTRQQVLALIQEAGQVQAINDYRLSDEDSAESPRYWGYLKPDGSGDWYILRVTDDPHEYRYAVAANNGGIGYDWSQRAALQYDALTVVSIP